MLRVLKIHFNICFIEPWSGEPVEKSRERGKERERERKKTYIYVYIYRESVSDRGGKATEIYTERERGNDGRK